MCTLAILLTGAIAFANVAPKAGHDARPLPGISATVKDAKILSGSGIPGTVGGGTAAPRADEYVIDDGTSEQGIGLTSGGTFFFFNQFNVLPAKELITGISVTWGSAALSGSSGLVGGESFVVRVYADNNGNADPTDTGATQIAQANGVVAAGSIDSDVFQTVPILANCVGQTSIYIGAEITHAAGGFPAPQDTDSAVGRSWVVFGGTYPANLDGALNIDDAGLPGNWLVRANAIPSVIENGACCNESAGTCQDDVSNQDCFQIPGARFLANGSCDDFDPPCGFAPGACCFEDATCIQVPQNWCRNKVVGDMDCDGDVDFFDIDPFVAALGGPASYFALYPTCNWMNADCDLDGDVDFFDIDPFVALIGLPPVTYPATFLGVGSSCAQCPCAIRCPAGSLPEFEPCGDDTNGGCNMTVPGFEGIECGQTICGSVYATSSLRDTDWYGIVLTQPSILTIELVSEMNTVFGLIEPVCYGAPFDCAGITGSINPFLSIAACTPGSVSTACVPAGEYVIFVAPAAFGAFGCEKEYNLRVTCEPCTLPTGACCFFPSGACTDSLTLYECGCLGGDWQGAATACADVVCPVPPANDLCAGAEYLDTINNPFVEFVVNNQYATDDGTPTCGTSAPYKGLWYRVTGIGDTMLVTTCNPLTTHPDTKIQIFCGCDYQCVTGKDDDGSLNCAQNGFLTSVQWCAAAGKDYYILIGSYGAADVGDIKVAVGNIGIPCTPTFAESCTPCVVECPVGGVAELEVCGEDTNGGCNYDVPPYLFETIACGETKCGTSWYDGSLRDTDWYRINLTSPQILTVSANAEFDVLVGLIAPPCPASAFVISDTGANCELSGFTTQCLSAGEYWIFIAPQFTATETCPSDYTLTVTCTPCAIQQGDTCEDPFVIPSLPYTVTGDTTPFSHNYNAVCPFTSTGARDVVYRYTTGNADESVTLSLCNDATDYDTKLYVLQGDCAGTAIACNDDECSTLSFPNAWVSRLECVNLLANTTYYFVVDGYSAADSGVYTLTVDACNPCVVECPVGGVAELEVCGEDTNGGCNMTSPAFEPIACGETKCGTSWFDGSTRDTDWYSLTLTSPSRITVEGSGEFPILLGVIASPCPATAFIVSGTADKCAIATATTADCLNPGTYYIFAASQFVGLTACPSDYYIRVTCTPCSATYCSAGVTTANCDEFIASVDIPGVLTNAGTGCGNGGPNGYADYTGISGNMTPGSSYAVAVVVGPPSYSLDTVSLWVDWNHNQIFDAAEVTSLVYTYGGSTGSASNAAGTISVPADAAPGATRMRVRLNYNAAPPACGTTTYGEVEDYTINVVP